MAITRHATPAIRREEARFRPRIERAYRRLVTRVIAELDFSEIEEALERGDTLAVNRLFDEAFEKVAGPTLEGIFTDTTTRAGKALAKKINKDFPDKPLVEGAP